MSFIKCPRCGVTVSTMAGTCPGCGVPIAGNLATCPRCGVAVLKDDTVCHACENELSQNVAADQPVAQDDAAQPVPQTPKKRWKKQYTIAIVAVLVVALGAVGYFLYQSHAEAKAREEEAFERVMLVTSDSLCQDFLDKFPDSQHCEAVRKRLETLQAEASEWSAIKANPSKLKIDEFLTNHPGSVYAQECAMFMDSLDWVEAVTADSEEALDIYVRNHPAGRFFEEASVLLNSKRMCRVTANDVLKVRSVLSTFFSCAYVDKSAAEVYPLLCDTSFTFCGNDTATVSSVLRHKLSVKENDVFRKNFVIDGDPQLTKAVVNGENIMVHAECQIKESSFRSDPTKDAEKLFHVAADFTEGFKIISINIKE